MRSTFIYAAKLILKMACNYLNNYHRLHGTKELLIEDKWIINRRILEPRTSNFRNNVLRNQIKAPFILHWSCPEPYTSYYHSYSHGCRYLLIFAIQRPTKAVRHQQQPFPFHFRHCSVILPREVIATATISAIIPGSCVAIPSRCDTHPLSYRLRHCKHALTFFELRSSS